MNRDMSYCPGVGCDDRLNCERYNDGPPAIRWYHSYDKQRTAQECIDIIPKRKHNGIIKSTKTNT